MTSKDVAWGIKPHGEVLLYTVDQLLGMLTMTKEVYVYAHLYYETSSYISVSKRSIKAAYSGGRDGEFGKVAARYEDGILYIG